MPVGFPATRSGVEIRILQRLFTPQEAAIALELSAIPEPVSAIHRRLESAITVQGLKRKLADMAGKGTILAIRSGQDLQYAKLVFAIGMYERQLPNLTAEFEQECREYFEEAFDKAFHTGKTPQMRIVPVNREIAAERSVSTYDQIRTYLEASTGPFAAIPCICRKGKSLLGKPCKQTKTSENCLMIGPAAEWASASGNGHALTRDGILALLDQADAEGLVLEPENTKSPAFICCCCGCCCGVLTSAKRLPNPASYFSSNFYAVTDTEACQSCGACEVRCQMDAISSQDGKAVVDRSRCIGCALCLSTCPSGALRLERNSNAKVPPDDTKALYLQLFQDRYGPWGTAALATRHMLGLKI
jgi:formate hydrogenlyase subunit 6/NADH:ubiquinone oxidoreductase subunit I